MSADPRVIDLVLRWEELRAAGHSVPAEELCRDCPELLPDVRRGLADLQALGGLVGTDSASPTDTPPPAVAAPAWAAAAGRYRPERFHAQGGLGEVHVAEDTELGRPVALKRIRPPLADQADSRRRFLREAAITARLQHPGIVPVYGLTRDEAGRPCYAMRLIAGEPLKAAIERYHGADPAGRNLALRQLLGRFVAVCKTVAYAHSQGVVHLDLKPANVMLGDFDETVVVDWGLARPVGPGEAAEAGGGGAGEASRADGYVAGTPAYMSPEQAVGRTDAVGPASDVYSLGATLYAVLTGRAPFEGGGEVLLRVQRGDFPRPRRVSPAVPRPLEAVCLKAMALHPEGRYATALELAADVERWLADEPVGAYREPLAARLQRLARRHRTLVTSGAGALVVTALVFAGATVRLNIAFESERAARVDAERAAEAEKKATDREAAQRQQAEAVTGLLESVFRKLDPWAEEKGGPGLKEQLAVQLDQTAKDVEKEYAREPLVRARLRSTLGLTQLGLGEVGKAEALIRAALAEFRPLLGEDHLDTLNTLHNLASAYREAGRTADAIRLFEQVRDRKAEKLGPDHPETLITLNNLARAYQDAGRIAEAITLFEQARDRQTEKRGPDHPDTLAMLNNLCWAYRDAGRTTDALTLLEQVRDRLAEKLGPDHPKTLLTLNNITGVYQDAGRTAEAITLFEQVRDRQTEKLGPGHPETLTTLDNLAYTYRRAGRTAVAIKMLEQVRDRKAEKLGPDHPSTLGTLDNLAGAYQDAGRTTEAIRLFEQVRDRQTEKLGPSHPSTLRTLANLAGAYQDAGRTADAIILLEQVRDRQKQRPDHPETMTTLNNLAVAYGKAGRLADALKILEQVRNRQTEKLGPGHPSTLTTLNNLAAGYWAAKRLDRSIPLFEEVLKLRKARSGPDHLDTLLTQGNLGVNYRDAGRLHDAIPLLEDVLDRARKGPGPFPAKLAWVPAELATAYDRAGMHAKSEPLYRQSLAAATKQFGPDDRRTADAMAQFGLDLLKQQKWQDAEPVLRDCLAVRQKKQPDAWTTFNTQSLLGGALLGQKKYAEAEPLLVAGYEGMKQREAAIPPPGRPRLAEALERLAHLYEATGQKERAAAYRKKLETSKTPQAQR